MRAALLASALLLPLRGAAAPSGLYGFNFPMWWNDAYSSPAAARGFADIAATGAGWVALTPTYYVNDDADSEVVSTKATPTDASLRVAIRSARAAGLSVVMKPHVDKISGGARATLSPRDRGRWFKTYRAHLVRLERLSREEGCSLFVVGTELALLTMPGDWSAWREVVAEARREFGGPLTYAANWHSAAHVGFWGELDYIGVDAYYPAAGGTNRTLLKASLFAPAAELFALSRLYGRPVLFTEFGLASQKGANLKPWAWWDFAPVDLETQTAYFDAFLETFAGRSWVAGFLHWAWDPDPSRGGPTDRSMSIKDKPALETFKSRFPASHARHESIAAAALRSLSAPLWQ